MKKILIIIFLFFSPLVFAIDEMDGMGDWSCQDWLKLNEVLKSESGSNLDKIIKVFKMLDSTTDDSNMDEKIQKILDENN